MQIYPNINFILSDKNLPWVKEFVGGSPEGSLVAQLDNLTRFLQDRSEQDTIRWTVPLTTNVLLQCGCRSGPGQIRTRQQQAKGTLVIFRVQIWPILDTDPKIISAVLHPCLYDGYDNSLSVIVVKSDWKKMTEKKILFVFYQFLFIEHT